MFPLMLAQEGSVFPQIALSGSDAVGAVMFAMVGVVTVVCVPFMLWLEARKASLLHQLKLELVRAGMSAAEIERVVRAAPNDSSKTEEVESIAPPKPVDRAA